MVTDTHHLRGTPAGTLEGTPDASAPTGARTPSPDVPARGASRYERGREAASGGDMSSPSASGVSSRTYHRWTAADRAAVVASYDRAGPTAAIRAGALRGISRDAVLTMLYQHRRDRGLPTHGALLVSQVVDMMHERGGRITVPQIVQATGLSPQGVRKMAARLGWICHPSTRPHPDVWTLPPEAP